MSRIKAAIEKRVERLYYKSCSGVQVNVLDIGSIFDTGFAAVINQPEISDADLTKVIVDFVEKIRRN
jgi:hypothetical protein